MQFLVTLAYKMSNKNKRGYIAMEHPHNFEVFGRVRFYPQLWRRNVLRLYIFNYWLDNPKSKIQNPKLNYLFYRPKLLGSKASLNPSPSKLNANTVRTITAAGGQINHGCSTKIEALVARDSILPKEGSGC